MFRKFIVETIRLGRRLRPNALWGLYDTPLCNYDAGERWPGGCREQFRKHNDKLVRNNCNLMQNQLCRLWWLYAEASALYSSIYLHPGDRKRRQGICERHMQAKVAEAEWIWWVFGMFFYKQNRILKVITKTRQTRHSVHQTRTGSVCTRWRHFLRARGTALQL